MIHKLGDPILREVAQPVTVFDADLQDFAEAMLWTQRHARGPGLAAPQVGRSIRVVVVGEDVLVNPKIVKASARVQRVVEECLSVPGRRVQKVRAFRVRVEYQDRAGEPQAMTREGFMAAVVQHEIDHLNGILITDNA